MSYDNFRKAIEDAIAVHEARDKAGSAIDHRYGMVIYSDGGGNNDTQGPCGAGAHGYLFDYAIGKVVSYLPPSQLTTDRGYYSTTIIARKPDGDDLTETKHKDKANYAVSESAFKEKSSDLKRVAPVAYFDLVKYLPKPSTSNRAELDGLIMGLNAAIAVQDLIESVHYRLDSAYTINGFVKSVLTWESNGWKRPNGEIKNVEMWKEIIELRKTLLGYVEGGLSVSIAHVSAHSGWYGNEAADKLTHKARIASTLDGPKLDVSSASRYFKNSHESNKFLSMPRWYYCTNDNQVIDGKQIYYVGRHGKEELDVAHGSRMSEQSYVAVLTDPDPTLEMLREHYEEMGADKKEDSIYYTYLDNVMSSKVYDDLTDNQLLYTRTHKGRCESADKKTLFVNIDPVNSAYVAFDHFKAIEKKLMNYLKGDLPGNHVLTDITDSIYDTKTVKDVTKLVTLPDGDAGLPVFVKHRLKGDDEPSVTKIILTRGIDLPRRSLFLSIVDDEPKVYALTWHVSRGEFRYATIVTTNKGDAGIWVGLFSNQHITSYKRVGVKDA